MASIALNYDSIYSAAKNAKKVASTTEDYVSSLQKNIIHKINDLRGPSSTYVENARTNITDKITQLNSKKDAYTEYSIKLEKFVDDEITGAKAIDEKVANLFKKDSEEFRENNNIKINPVTNFFTFLVSEVTNASDFARKVSEIYTDAKNWISDRMDSIKDWYRYKGGKYIVEAIKEVLETVGFVAIMVVTIPAAPILAVATGILIGFTILNGLSAGFNDIMAYK